MSLEILIKKVEDSLKNKQLMTVLKYLAEIRNRYPLNKRVEEFISLKKKKYKYQLKIVKEIVDLQKQLNKENFIKKINELLELDPENAYLYGLLGDHHGMKLDFKTAKLYQEKAISLCPFEEVFYINLSKSLTGLKLHKKSLEVLKLSKILKPNDFEINLLIARCSIRLLDQKFAFNIYDELLNSEPNNLELSIEFCQHLLDFRETDKAIKILDKINLDQNRNQKIITLYGIAKLNQELPKEAKKLFSEALKCNEKSSNLYTFIGIANEKLNMYSEAIKNHKKAIELDRSNFLAYSNLAITFSFFGEIQKAISYLLKSIEINPEYHEGIYKLGQ